MFCRWRSKRVKVENNNDMYNSVKSADGQKNKKRVKRGDTESDGQQSESAIRHIMGRPIRQCHVVLERI